MLAVNGTRVKTTDGHPRKIAKKVGQVLKAHARSHPGTVVVHLQNADVAYRAVVALRWLGEVAAPFTPPPRPRTLISIVSRNQISSVAFLGCPRASRHGEDVRAKDAAEANQSEEELNH